MMEIEYFKNLNITKTNKFEYHMGYLNEKIVHFTIKNYLNKIVGENFETEFMTIKDFMSILTISMYSEEFMIKEDETEKITEFIKKFEYINENYKGINLEKWYTDNILCELNEVKDIFNKVMHGNMMSICDNYHRIYYNVDKLCKEIEDKKMKGELELFRDEYYNLINQILKDKTDKYIEDMNKKKENNDEYDKFRKSIFLDKLEKDLKEKKYDGIVYLLDIIRIKLCNISPVNSKYDYMKTQINEILDIKYIDQMIKNDVFGMKELMNVLEFIVEKMLEYGSETNNKEVELWIKNVKEKELVDLNNKNECIILPKIMEKVMDHLEKLEKDVVKYREHIYLNMKDE